MRIALALCALWVLAGMASPFLPLAPDVVHLARIFAPPGEYGLLGHDDLGRDILHRLVDGAGISLLVAVSATLVSALVGCAVGLVAGYMGGWTDRLVSRVIDVFLAFPGILLAIALAAVSGPGIDKVITALAAMGWVSFARLVRVQILSLKTQEHVLAARALGRGSGAIMLRHLLPLAAAPVMVEVSFGLAGAVLAEASLSFLGLGIQAPQASWGAMIRDGVRYMLVAPHLVLAPGVALCLVVLAVNRLGDHLRDRWDVTSRSRR